MKKVATFFCADKFLVGGVAENDKDTGLTGHGFGGLPITQHKVISLMKPIVDFCVSLISITSHS